VTSLRIGAAVRHIVLILVCMAALGPVYLMVSGSLKTQSQFLDSPWSLPATPTLDAFTTTLTGQFGRWVLNSVVGVAGSDQGESRNCDCVFSEPLTMR
jgi:raffinose/stachyose/melibiose transport system permease protein